MNKTVNATTCTKETFLSHSGTKLEIVRYWDGTCYINRADNHAHTRTPDIPEFTTYGEIRNAYAKVYGIILPEAKHLSFGPAGCHKQYAYAVV